MGSIAAIVPAVGAAFVKKEGQESASRKIEGAARERADIEALNRVFQQEMFQKGQQRRQPLLQSGQYALPKLIESISNRGDVSNLPATRIQGSIISEYLGEESPNFITEDALSNMQAMEAEKNKQRLSNLVNIGLGGLGSTIQQQSGMNRFNALSTLNENQIRQNAIQQAAIDRSNRNLQFGNTMAGLPAYIATATGFTGQGAGGGGNYSAAYGGNNPFGGPIISPSGAPLGF